MSDSPWLRLLNKKPGSPEDKARWLENELPLIEAEAAKGFGSIEPSKTALNGAIRALVLRYYRVHERSLRPKGPTIVATPEDKALAETRQKIAAAAELKRREHQPAGGNVKDDLQSVLDRMQAAIEKKQQAGADAIRERQK